MNSKFCPAGGHHIIALQSRTCIRCFSVETLPGKNPQDIAKLVQADIEARAQLGERKYGARLSALSRENNKSPLRNAYEEVLDTAMYLKQELVERGDDG